MVLYFIIPMIISLILVFPVKWIAIKLGLFAKVNERTIHHGQIPRIGGVAIFIAFIIGIAVFQIKNSFIRGALVGGSLIFAEGLIDDIYDVKPIVKVICQLIAAILLIVVGEVSLNVIHLPFNIFIRNKVLTNVLIVFWIIGITNAINLLDGLDGLASGFSIIVLMTVALLSYRNYLFSFFRISLILAGATMGFLFHNFNPASIFMGDCGSQLLGFLIAAITLAGFKSATFITFLVPIILLFIPILDTLSAIVRRKLKGESFATPDKSHFHHQLMNGLGLGQKGAVLVIYIITALFGLTAYIYMTKPEIGLVLLLFMFLIFELFVEYTDMISINYRPILNLIDKLLGKKKDQ